VRTSVISFPRSPHPMYTTIFASHHFASWCSETVFPVPNPPGIAAVPPFAIGNRKSKTRCPVTRGIDGSSFSLTGRGRRTGHVCMSVSLAVSSSTTVSSTRNSPAFTSFTVPETFGGTMTRCSTNFASCTVPRTCPGCTLSPGFTVGRNGHLFWRSSPGARTPRSTKSPIFALRTGSGRWIPS